MTTRNRITAATMLMTAGAVVSVLFGAAPASADRPRPVMQSVYLDCVGNGNNVQYCCAMAGGIWRGDLNTCVPRPQPTKAPSRSISRSLA